MKKIKLLKKLVTLSLAIVLLSGLVHADVFAAEITETPNPIILPTQTRGQTNIDGTPKKKLVQVLWDIDGGDKCVVILDVPDEYQLYYEPDLFFCGYTLGGKYGYMSTAWMLSAYDANGNLMNFLNPWNGLNYYDFSAPGICTYKQYRCYKELWETKQYPVTNLGQNKYVNSEEVGLFGFTEDGIFYFDQENLGDPQLYYYNEQGQFDHAVDTMFPDLRLDFFRNKLGQVVDCADGGGRRGGFIIDYDEEGYIAHVYSYGRSGATGAFPKANYLTNPKLTFIWE